MTMKQKPVVVIGLLGTTLDSGSNEKRWDRWRPTVALCQHSDLIVSRFELLYGRKYSSLGKVVTQDIQSVSPETVVRHHDVEFQDPWSLEQVYEGLLDFAKKYPFQTDKEDYLIHITTGTHIAQICMFLLTESRYLPARLIQGSPGKGNSKDTGSYTIIDLDLSRYDKIAKRFAIEKTSAISFLKSGINTKNEAFNSLIDRIEVVASRAKEPLLISGPTGAGKSSLAQKIYELKKSRHLVSGNFVAVNCATIKGDGAMSTLFGHTKGSFTGAASDRPGLLRAADGGLLFLDEIGELGPDEQAMLLKALEEKKFFPLGSDKEVKSDFQLVAGTNKDLGNEVARGNFREDLLARIDIWTFDLPGLKERREDIEPNLDFELEKFAQKTGNRVTFNKESREMFLKFALSHEATWNANFRDLNAAVLRMGTLASGGRIVETTVRDEIVRLKRSWRRDKSDRAASHLEQVLSVAQIDSLDLFDRIQLEGVVAVCRRTPNLSEAGRELFSASREKRAQKNDADRLRKYLQRFGLDFEGIKDHP